MEQMGLHAAAYSAAIYCRLSKDDAPSRCGSADAESTSIGTQKTMLEKYCREQGFSICDVYVDDGYSGLNFNRPDFNRLLTDIDGGKVNLVVTKDLSRLGRDYIQTGYYLEIYFARKKIRYIAVNDNIDTLRPDNDIAPFRNILNDLYAKDLSRKVKSAKRQRAANGYYISAQPPYGYNPDPTNKNRLAIDQKAAEVVREIYRLSLAEHSAGQIADILTKRKTPTPSAYKVQNGDTRFIRQLESGGGFRWCRNTVHNILRDMVYMGDMENHKYEVVNYKTKEYRPVPKDQHIIVENTHEPIISRDDWNRVQALIAARHRPKRHDYENVFKSIVFCLACGHHLTIAFKYSPEGERISPYYRCTYRYTNRMACRHPLRISYDDLCARVWGQIQEQIKKAEDGAMLKKSRARTMQRKMASGLESERTQTASRLSILAKITKQLYEDHACGKLDTDSCHALLGEYQAEQKNLSARLQTIERERARKDVHRDNLQMLNDALLSCANDTKLTAQILNQLVERIEVGHLTGAKGQKKQRIDIIYRYIGMTL